MEQATGISKTEIRPSESGRRIRTGVPLTGCPPKGVLPAGALPEGVLEAEPAGGR